MWVFLWIIIVLAVIIGVIWSYRIVFEQQRAWAVFAKKYGMTCKKMGLFKAPDVAGQIKDKRVNIYSLTQINPETGVQQISTMIEVFLNNDPGVYGAVSSTGFLDYMNTVQLPMPFMVEHPQWPQNILARTFENEQISAWFSEKEERILAIKELNALPFDTIFVANDNNSFVGIRTTHPLDDPKRINQIVGKLFKIAEGLDSTSPSNTQEQIANPNGDKESVSSSSEDSNP